MKKYFHLIYTTIGLIISFGYIFSSCSNPSKEKEKPVTTKKTDSEIVDTINKISTSTNFIIVSGVSFGDILPTSSEKDLIQIFGEENVIRDSIHIGEGYYEIGTTVFKNSPNEISIIWNDSKNVKSPSYITVKGSNSNWVTNQGIQIGTSLKQLETINGGPFTMTGFAWDYAGTIIEWKNGKLAAIAGESNDKMLIRLGEYENLKITPEEYQQLIGDIAFESSNKLLQKMNPIVYQMVFGFIH
jgi:hypothetical protein